MDISIVDILRFLHQEDTSDGLQLAIDTWISVSEENRKEFQLLKFIYDQRPDVVVPQSFHKEGDWEAFVNRLQSESVSPTPTLTNSWIPLIAILAILSIALCAYFFLRTPYVEVINQNNYADNKIELPDGSSVDLEPNSMLRYKRDFAADSQRYVILSGDAKFDVAHNDNKPFYVEIDDVAVQVLGTVFTVEKDRSTNTATIANLEGLINCYEIVKPSNSQILKEGDKAIWDGKEFDFIPAVKEEVKGSNQSLNNILKYLSSERFDKVIEFAPYMTFDYEDQVFADQDLPIEEFLDQLVENGGMEYTKLPGGRYYIYQLKTKK